MLDITVTLTKDALEVLAKNRVFQELNIHPTEYNVEVKWTGQEVEVKLLAKNK